MGLAGALLLSEILPSLQLSELNIGFNEIEADGLISIIKSLVHNSYLHSLTLSGNAIDGEVSRLLAFMLVHNSALEKLYLDRTNMDLKSEKNIAAGLASSKSSALRTLTGFSLGPVLSALGSPSLLASLSNDRVLSYLSEMWASKKEAERLEHESSLSDIVGTSAVLSGSDSTSVSVTVVEVAMNGANTISSSTDYSVTRNMNSAGDTDIFLTNDSNCYTDGSHCADSRNISAFSSQRVSDADILDPTTSATDDSTAAAATSATSAVTDTMDLTDQIPNIRPCPLRVYASDHFDGYKEGDMIKRFSFAGILYSSYDFFASMTGLISSHLCCHLTLFPFSAVLPNIMSCCMCSYLYYAYFNVFICSHTSF